MSQARLLAFLVLAGALVRAPFLLRALETPVDADTAIVGLMARHPGQGTTLWGQPYGSPLDAWVAMPFVAALGPTRAALRVPYFLLGLALVPLAFALARAVRPAAALPAAALVALPPAYLAILSVLPPPLYATTLVLLGLLLLLTVRMPGPDAVRPPWLRLAAWGAAAGLALWTHLMSGAVVLAAGIALAARWRRRPAPLVVAALAFAAASAPWWTRLPSDPSALWAVSAERAPGDASPRIVRTATALHEPLGVLLGARAPLTPDDADRTRRAPAAVAVLLVLAYASALAAALRFAGGPALRLLVAAVALTVIVFPLPARAGPDTPRFLTPAFLPLVVLVAVGASLLAPRWRRALLVTIVAGHLVTAALVLAAWRDPAVELAPDCAAVRRALAERGIARAWASYNMAYCLTYESGEAIVASQPWNERFLGYPLPFLHEVRRARDVAWVLVPGKDFELPSPRHFEARLRAIGGRYARDVVGDAVIFHSFEPPFGPSVVRVATPAALGDARLDTGITYPARSSVVVAPAAPVPVAAVTLVAGGSTSLPADVTLEVSADGMTFERVFRRRPGRERVDLFWINGHPQHADDTYLSVGLDGRTLAALRVGTAGAVPWGLAEVLLHPPQPAAPWAAPPAGRPGPDRTEWYLSLPRVPGSH